MPDNNVVSSQSQTTTNGSAASTTPPATAPVAQKSAASAEAPKSQEQPQSAPDMLLAEAEVKSEEKGGDKKEEQSATASEDYQEFKLPEGLQFDGEKLKESKTLMKKFGLKQDQAQEAVEYVAKMVQEQAQASAKKVDTMWADTTKAWGEATKSDKEVGGANYKVNREYALRAIKDVNPEFKQLLMEGLGNHPGVFKYLVQQGKAMSEDSPSQSNTGGSAELSKEDAFKKTLFGNYPGRAETRKP